MTNCNDKTDAIYPVWTVMSAYLQEGDRKNLSNTCHKMRNDIMTDRNRQVARIISLIESIIASLKTINGTDGSDCGSNKMIAEVMIWDG
jgi:hypothetical protein